MANKNLVAAKAAKLDEYYTQWADIEREMNSYLEYDPDVFRGRDCCSIRWHLTGLACGAGWEDGCHGQALPTGVPRGCRARRPQS